MVERQLPKLNVVGSTPIARSNCLPPVFVSEDAGAVLMPDAISMIPAAPVRSTEAGIFFAVAGPSGAGKDTLMRLAEQQLQDDDRFVFPRRVITRPAHAASEEHIPVSPEDFAAQNERGAFVLTWKAHGLSYGIPLEVQDALSAGRNVVANISRGAIADAMHAFDRVCVLRVTASPDSLAERLTGRGREGAQAVRQRLNRQAAELPAGCDLIEIDNSSSPEEGARLFVTALLGRIGGNV